MANTEGTWRNLQRRHYPDALYQRAEEMLAERPTPTAADMARRLEKEAKKDRPDLAGLRGPGSARAGTPSEKTLGDWIRLGTIRAQPLWSLAEAKGDEAALILPVLPYLLEEWHRQATRAIAEWIVRIRRAAPALQDLEEIAYLAQLASRGGVYLERVELYLAYAPWIDEEHARRLAEAVDRQLLGAQGMEVALLADVVDEVSRAQFRRTHPEKGNHE